MKVTIGIKEANNGKFSDLTLSYINSNGIYSEVPLLINEYSSVFDFNEDLTSIKFDLFLISTFVYGVDNLLSREIYSFDGWAREIEVDFPVNNLTKWQGNELLLAEILNFLTGDYWTVSFIQNKTINHFLPSIGIKTNKNSIIFEKEKVKYTSLFSGGLDSLIGIIDILEILKDEEKILLVSHFDFKSSGPNSDQNKLYKYLNCQYPNKIYWVQSKIALGRRDNNLNKVSVESNYRSRSFLFIGLGCFLSPIDELIIPENGTISINYPLTPSRVSSLSTRTTHPFVLNKVQELLNECGLDIKIDNPYKFETKGRMVADCKNKNVLKNIFKDSVSCGKRGRKQNWEEKKGVNQCGVCMPCIYRRAALNKAKFDEERYGNDILGAKSLNSFVDLPSLFSYLNKIISFEQMKRDLVVNGSIESKDLDKYAKMVLESKEEILQLFRDKGKEFVKSQLKL
ncbi:hypothetical protein ABID42_002261 [Arcicella rosea]|uniref:Qat anti-phage system QueC-like protein QatC n=1 Tax=Arcicella rosea TaxID=502909 RepID=UPI00345C911A